MLRRLRGLEIGLRLRPGRGESPIAVLIAALILLVSALPLVRVVAEATTALPAIASSSALRALLRTVITSLGGGAVAVLFGGPFAAAVALTDARAKRLLSGAAMLPLLIPGQIVALAWMQALPHAQALYSPVGIILLLGIEHMPIGFLAVRAAMGAIPMDLVDAARAEAASKTRLFTRILLPLSIPGLTAGFGLATVSCLGSFGVPAMIGIPARYPTLAVLIYQRLSGIGTGVLPQAASLSLPLMALSGVVAILAARLAARTDTRTSGAGMSGAPLELGPWKGPVTVILLAIAAVMILLPLVSLLAISATKAYGVPLRPATFTLAHYATVLGTEETSRAFLTSAWLAGISAIIGAGAAILIAVLTAWSGPPWIRRMMAVLNPLIQAPFALPGTVLAIGMILLYLAPLPVIGSLYGTPWIILLAYIPRFLPLALGPVQAALARLEPALDEAARAQGAGFARRLRRIAVPLIAPAAASGAILVLMTAFGELTVSALLWSPGNQTVGVLIFGLNEGGDISAAAAASVLCLVFVFVMAAAGRLLGRMWPL